MIYHIYDIQWIFTTEGAKKCILLLWQCSLSIQCSFNVQTLFKCVSGYNVINLLVSLAQPELQDLLTTVDQHLFWGTPQQFLAQLQLQLFGQHFFQVQSKTSTEERKREERTYWSNHTFGTGRERRGSGCIRRGMGAAQNSWRARSHCSYGKREAGEMEGCQWWPLGQAALVPQLGVEGCGGEVVNPIVGTALGCVVL